MLGFSTALLRHGAKVRNMTNLTRNTSSLSLYQYNICPFCHKIKALLAYVAEPYEAVEVNPLTKSELKSLGDNYSKVPVLKMNEETISDSNVILHKLLQSAHIQSKLEEKWKSADTNMTMDKFAENGSWVFEFVDKELASILYPNICRTLGDSYKAFEYVHDNPNFSPFQRYTIQGIGSVAMYFAASKIKQKRNITDERKALLDALDVFERDALSSPTQFVSGKSVPNLEDIAVFGVLRSVQGLPAHEDLVLKHSEKLNNWYKRMQQEVPY